MTARFAARLSMNDTFPFVLTLLSAAMAMPVYALEAISDADMSDATGEGVAFIPQNFRMILQGASTPDAAGASTVSLADRTLDTGFIRYIPVGPLSAVALQQTTVNPNLFDTNSNGTIDANDVVSVGKSELYLYGLGISQSEATLGTGRTSTQWNSRYNAASSGVIQNLGSYINPWVLRVKTDPVPNFAGTVQSLPYLQLEAPLYTTAALSSLTTADQAQYNLKMGFWADALVRDPSKVEGDSAQFDLGGSGRANRLRLQGVWDGFSLNGSKLQLFQTLGGATNAGGMSTSYNNTLGLAGVLRFNSGDAANLKGTYTQTFSTHSTSIPAGSSATGADAGYGIVWDGNTYGTTANYTNTSGTSGGAASPACNANTGTHEASTSSCRNRYEVRIASDTAASATWTPPSVLPSVFRLSTQETTDTALTATPAVNGGAAPTFQATEGLYLYNLNTNLVLGGLSQPVMAGVAADGRNIVLEIARIPNVQSVYQTIYTRYAGDTGDAGVTYTGSTCNLYQCGTSAISGYQGNSATHSSISIGTTNYDSANNLLTAYSGSEAVGVSFGALVSGSFTSPAQSYTDDVKTSTRSYGCFFGCSWNGWGGWNPLAVGSSASYNLKATSPNTWTQPAAPLPVPTAPVGAAMSNNFGSAVIDGLLIQHLKMTTTGL